MHVNAALNLRAVPWNSRPNFVAMPLTLGWACERFRTTSDRHDVTEGTVAYNIACDGRC